MPDFEGPLSIKTVLRGSALWRASGRDFRVNEGCYLILNDRQPYTITIDSALPVTTFCVFFERGFVEDVFRTLDAPQHELLDQPDNPAKLSFSGHLAPCDDLARSIAVLAKRLARNELTWPQWEDAFFALALRVTLRDQKLQAAAATLPAVRESTRVELCRRVLRGRDVLLASTDSRVRLKEIARQACLSPYHFHRSFQQFFGTTPHQYLLRYRLERAARALLATDQSITGICLELGFDNPASFSTSFRNRFGVSPREFRRK